MKAMSSSFVRCKTKNIPHAQVPCSLKTTPSPEDRISSAMKGKDEGVPFRLVGYKWVISVFIFCFPLFCSPLRGAEVFDPLRPDIPKQIQDLEFCQSQRRSFDFLEAASYPGDRSDAEELKNGEPYKGIQPEKEKIDRSLCSFYQEEVESRSPTNEQVNKKHFYPDECCFCFEDSFAETLPDPLENYLKLNSKLIEDTSFYKKQKFLKEIGKVKETFNPSPSNEIGGESHGRQSNCVFPSLEIIERSFLLNTPNSFDLLQVAVYPGDRSNAEELKDGEPYKGKNQLLNLFGYSAGICLEAPKINASLFERKDTFSYRSYQENKIAFRPLPLPLTIGLPSLHPECHYPIKSVISHDPSRKNCYFISFEDDPSLTPVIETKLKREVIPLTLIPKFISKDTEHLEYYQTQRHTIDLLEVTSYPNQDLSLFESNLCQSTNPLLIPKKVHSFYGSYVTIPKYIQHLALCQNQHRRCHFSEGASYQGDKGNVEKVKNVMPCKGENHRLSLLGSAPYPYLCKDVDAYKGTNQILSSFGYTGEPLLIPLIKAPERRYEKYAHRPLPNQKLEFCQNQSLRFDSLAATSYPREQSDAKGSKKREKEKYMIFQSKKSLPLAAPFPQSSLAETELASSQSKDLLHKYQKEKLISLGEVPLSSPEITGLPSDSEKKVLNQSKRLTSDFLEKIPPPSHLETISYDNEFETKVYYSKKEEGEGYFFSIKMQPAHDLYFASPQQHFIFVVDGSSSIKKHRFGVFKEGIGRALSYLREGDSFNIIIADAEVIPFSKTPTSWDKSAVSRATRFLMNQNYRGFFVNYDIFELLSHVSNYFDQDKENVVILLTDGHSLKTLQDHKKGLTELSQKSRENCSIFTATASEGNNLSMLDLLSTFNHGELVYSKTNASFSRHLSILVKHIESFTAKEIHLNVTKGDDKTQIEFYPNTPSLPFFYTDRPYMIYGSIDQLKDFDLIVQGKCGDKWINIKQTISFKHAEKATRSIKKGIALQRAYVCYDYFLKNGDPFFLNEAQNILGPFQIPTVVR